MPPYLFTSKICPARVARIPVALAETVKVVRSLFPLALLVLLTVICGCTTDDSGNSPSPRARQGIIDLSTVALSGSEPVRLDGEWEFYWKQLLTPDDFRRARSLPVPAYFSLPDSWNNFKLNENKLGSAGYATFRLNIMPGPGNRELALRLVELDSAYKLWANGTLIVENGVVGTDAAGEIPRQAVQLPRFTIRDEGRPIELVLQISNFHYREGGISSSIELGQSRTVEQNQLRTWVLALLCIGSQAVMGMYHLALYFSRKKDTTPLYFGVYCLLWMVNSFTSNASDWVVNLLFTAVPAAFVYRIDLLCFIASIPVGYAFFLAMYPKEFSPRLQQFTWIISLLFVCMGLVVSTMSFTSAIPAFYLFSIAMIVYCLTMLFKAAHRRREGAPLILLGFIVMGGTGINDMLYDLHLIHSVYLIHIGMFVFMLFQAVALSSRFSKAFSAVEHLSDELSEKNQILEDEVSERTKLAHEIVHISDDERRRISHNLHDGLCQKLTGARLQCSALERKLVSTGQQQPQLAQLSLLLEESVNEAYDLSRGLWPVEHDLHGVSLSLEELAHHLSESSGMDIQFKHERACTECLNSRVLQLSRIAQEAITNAVKHSGASRVTVILNCLYGNRVSLKVEDDGVGRSAAAATKGGLGMVIMSYRARSIGGTLTVADAEGGGTSVTCVAPCETHSEHG